MHVDTQTSIATHKSTSMEACTCSHTHTDRSGHWSLSCLTELSFYKKDEKDIPSHLANASVNIKSILNRQTNLILFLKIFRKEEKPHNLILFK